MVILALTAKSKLTELRGALKYRRKQVVRADYFLTSGQVESASLPKACSPDIFCTTR
jgi:hypothetical protein